MVRQSCEALLECKGTKRDRGGKGLMTMIEGYVKKGKVEWDRYCEVKLTKVC